MDLQFEVGPANGYGRRLVIARLADKELHRDRFDTDSAGSRRRFFGELGRRLQANGQNGEASAETLLAMFERDLLRQADKADRAAEAGGPEPDSQGPEIDAGRIIRPERFITPEVSGIAVPVAVRAGNGVRGQWFWYLRWADGKRERRPVGNTLELPGGGRLWVHPDPGEPAPGMAPGWSAEARRRWLAGEPAPTPADVFQGLCRQVARFIELPQAESPGIAATLALWVIHTYCYVTWSAVPYLYVGGPIGSGKTRVLDVLGRLVFRPLSSSNMTAAALFRTLHAQGGTVLLDEAERLRNTQDPAVGDLLSLLLAGNRRGGTATRLEPAGDSFRPVSFEVFGPKALCCVTGLPAALASRCIGITMFRAGPESEKPRRRIDEAPETWQRLRDDLHALALEHGPEFLELAGWSDVCPNGIAGRHYELWQALLALAGWIEEHGAIGLLGRLQGHALATIEASTDDQIVDSDEILLRLLADAIRAGEKPRPGDLLEKAKEREPETFRKWTARGVAERLKRYRLCTIKVSGEKRYPHNTLDGLRRIQANYGIDLAIEAV
ncbi:MAG: hypothetical protein ACUVXB_17100 [Bryobacteraceae bacterium]